MFSSGGRNSAMSGQSHHQHRFSLTPQINIERSTFNRSHGHKTTFNEGYLIPILVDEVLPGDTHRCSLTALCRMSTPIYPIMDNLYFETHFWFVPSRLVWEHWEQFNGQQTNPTDSTDFILPTVTSGSGGFLTGSLADYFGIATLSGAAVTVQSLPFRAYNLIYQQWYQDENLQTSPTIELDDGPDTLANYAVLRRGKRHDYFTSCLPWPQKINDGTVVEIPLGVSAPVYGTGVGTGMVVEDQASGHVAQLANNVAVTAFAGTALSGAFTSGGAVNIVTKGAYASSVYADLTDATAASINQLRQAFQMQVLFERDARGGTRYTEIIRAHFNCISPDQRLQRPEYLGGGSQNVMIHPVTQNAPATSTADTPQGNLAGFGVGHISGHGFIKSFVEHGYIIGIASVRADITYSQGINRLWQRSTRYDFYWPALAHIGEQAVLNQEIYATGTSTDVAVFGYQERYAEYRYKPSIITGLFRPNASGTLDAWHLSQNFGSLPSLNSTFIVENAPMSRVEAVSTGADFICDMFFDYKSTRPMPLYGTPMQLGRF